MRQRRNISKPAYNKDQKNDNQKMGNYRTKLPRTTKTNLSTQKRYESSNKIPNGSKYNRAKQAAINAQLQRVTKIFGNY